jgi:hypothetical protein
LGGFCFFLSIRIKTPGSGHHYQWGGLRHFPPLVFGHHPIAYVTAVISSFRYKNKIFATDNGARGQGIETLRRLAAFRPSILQLNEVPANGTRETVNQPFGGPDPLAP